MRRLLPLLLVLSAAPGFAEAPAWRATGPGAVQPASVDDLTLLAGDFPDSASVQLRLLNALMNAGSTDEAGQVALQLATRGYAFEQRSEAVIIQNLDLDYATWFQSKTKVNRLPIERSSLLSTIPAEAQLVEGVARDPKTGDLYATTVVSRSLYVKRGEAEWQRLDLPGAGSLSGIAYDAKNRLFWIASGDFEQTPGEKVQSALLGFDPAQGKAVRTLYANGMVALGDVAVGDDGTVYAADPEQGIIHTAAAGDEGLRALVGQGVFRSPQGMVAVPGKKLLIVSDYRYGLAALDTATGKVSRIASAKPAMLDGIDGLARWGNNLIAVQNGTSPKRILKLDMSGDWLSIEKVTVLESNHSGWTEPVGGTVDGSRLLYVGTGQWDAFGDGGVPVAGTAPGPTGIRALPLGK